MVLCVGNAQLRIHTSFCVGVLVCVWEVDMHTSSCVCVIGLRVGSAHAYESLCLCMGIHV